MHEHEHLHSVRIHIDERVFHSPNHTTGAALYALGSVARELALYREVTGNREDARIDDGPDAIHLHEDDHFHSGKITGFRIFVNGQQKTVTSNTVTFETIVLLAFPTPPTGENVLFSVGYEDGPHKNPCGTLMPGQKVAVKNGMIFNVTSTDKS